MHANPKLFSRPAHRDFMARSAGQDNVSGNLLAIGRKFPKKIHLIGRQARDCSTGRYRHVPKLKVHGYRGVGHRQQAVGRRGKGKCRGQRTAIRQGDCALPIATMDWEDPDSTVASAVLVPLAPTFFSKSSNFTRVSSQMYSMIFQPGFKMYFRWVFKMAV